MRKAKSYYKEEQDFDLIQKTKRDGSNINITYTGEFNDLEKNLQNSKISQANIYLSGLLSEMKETISNIDDDIFSEIKNDNPKTPKNRLSLQNKLSFYSKSPHSGNNLSSKSIKTIFNNSNDLSSNRSLLNSNYINNNNNFINEDKTKMKIKIMNRFETKKKYKNNYVFKDNLTPRASITKINSLLNNNPNTISKKSSIRLREIKRYSYYFNPTQKFLKPFRTSTLNIKNVKSVKFDIPKKTNTNTIFTKKINKNNINNLNINNNNNINFRRWSEIREKRSSKESNLFSFFQKPEFFDEIPKKNATNEFNYLSFSTQENHEHDKIFKLSQLSNKNIIELNEIQNDLKKTLIFSKKTTSNFRLSNLDKKDFLYDHEDSFEEDENKIGKIEKKKNEKEDDFLNNKDIEKKYRELQRKSPVYDSLDEYNDEDISTFFIHPDSKYLKILDFFVSICVIYNLINIPLFLGYNNIYCRIDNFFTFYNFIEILIDIIYFIDFIVHFFVGFYNNDDILKTENIQIIIHNLKNWFIIDLLCVIPFKTILTIFDTKCKNINYLLSKKYQNEFYYLLICFRFLKTFRLSNNKFFEIIDEKLDKYEHYNNYLSFYLIGIIFCLTLHIVSCLLIFIGKNDYPSWIIYFNFEQYSFSKLYFLGIYYIITTVTTVGYGDLFCYTPKEKIFAIIIEIVGIVSYSYVLTSISNYVKSQSDVEEEYFKKYQILEDIKMNYSDFSDDLFERIDRYLKHKQTNEDQEKNLIYELPISLKNALVYNMYEPIIENFIFFKNFDNKDFIVKVIFSFKPILAIKNDILIKDGDFVEDIIFIKKGKITLELPIRINADKENENKQSIGNTLSNKSNFNFNKNNLKNINTLSNFQNSNSQTRKESTKFDIIKNNFIEEIDEDEIIEYQNYKILDIRKNEHFGEVLMLSNERSPLIAIVKSRKAELFYLNKKDAIEISNEYPQIWSKIQKKSFFNMKQIKRLMIKISKIFYNSKKEDITNSNVSNNNESDLQTIPSISDYNENIKNKYKQSEEIKNLGTIKEATTIIEDSENSSSSENSKSKISYSKNSNSKISNSKITSSKNSQSLSSKTEKNQNNSSSISSNSLDSKNSLYNLSETKKINDESDYSSNFNYSNLNETVKVETKNNFDVDFSETISDKENNLINKTKKSKLTPYNPEDINMEIYPNENFKTYNTSGNNNQYYFNKINNINDHNNKNNIKRCNNLKNKNLNISICSTEISFSINSKYENIDELSDYRYSKTPKLRKKIKSILRDYDNESEYEYKNYQRNHSEKKPIIYINDKKVELKKSSSADLLKRKKKKKKKKKIL